MKNILEILFVLVLLSSITLGQSVNNAIVTNQPEIILSNIMEDSTSVLIEQIAQHWNGSAWINQSKNSIKYNQIGLKESEKVYGWNGNDWIEYKRTFYEYNSFNYLMTLYTEEASINWDTTSITNYLYDDVGRECERIVTFWDYNQEIHVKNKVISNYTDGNLSDVIYQFYENELWYNTNKTIYRYNSTNSLIERITQIWINNAWSNNSSYNYIFDEKGNKIKSVQISWDNSICDTLNMHLFIYNADNQLVEESRKVKQEGKWIDDSIFSYDYNEYGQIVFQMFQYWADLEVINGNRNYYEYNINGQLSQESEQGWRNGNWENNYKINYIYDLNGNVINKIYNNWVDGNWTNTVQYLYTYGVVTNIINNEYTINDFQLTNNYPNPFNPSTRIKYSIPKSSHVRLVIYSALGEEVKTLIDQIQNQGVYEVIFNANSLASGIYIYRIEVDHKYSDVKKMLLLK